MFKRSMVCIVTCLLAHQSVAQLSDGDSLLTPEKVIVQLMNSKWPASMEIELKKLSQGVTCDQSGCQIDVGHRRPEGDVVLVKLKIYPSGGPPVLSKDSGSIHFSLSAGACFNLDALALLGQRGPVKRQVAEHMIDGKLTQVLDYRIYGQFSGLNADAKARFEATAKTMGCYYSLSFDSTGKFLGVFH